MLFSLSLVLHRVGHLCALLSIGFRHLIVALGIAPDVPYCSEAGRAVHSFEIVLIESISIVTGDAEPDLFNASELVLIVGTSLPLTSTRCPRYLRSFILPVA
jgi:hypothetical protein